MLSSKFYFSLADKFKELGYGEGIFNTRDHDCITILLCYKKESLKVCLLRDIISVVLMFNEEFLCVFPNNAKIESYKSHKENILDEAEDEIEEQKVSSFAKTVALTILDSLIEYHTPRSIRFIND